jgi:hypothetical protein
LPLLKKKGACMHEKIYISKRFCGPPDSGNGGYVCGLLAQHVGGTAEVRLLKPPPLEKTLKVEMGEEETMLLMDGDIAIARAKKASLDLQVPAPPSFDKTCSASQGYFASYAEHHFFPTCFVCGPKREVRDGLRIYPGPVNGFSMMAAPWSPDDTLLDEGNQVRPEFIWASLDCPGAFAVIGACVRPVVLGSLTAEILRKPLSGQECITLGWDIGAQGRKHTAGTALFTREGELLAKAKAIWIEI